MQHLWNGDQKKYFDIRKCKQIAQLQHKNKLYHTRMERTKNLTLIYTHKNGVIFMIMHAIYFSHNYSCTDQIKRVNSISMES